MLFGKSEKLPKGVKINENSRFEDVDDGTPVYLVDGACSNNGREKSFGGCSFVTGLNHFGMWTDKSSPSTSLSAELGAILGAVKDAVENGDKHITIMSDCKNAIDCLDQWSRMKRDENGQRYTKKGKKVANQDIISKIKKLLADNDVLADLVHISREDNKIADQLAKMAKYFGHSLMLGDSGSETKSAYYSYFTMNNYTLQEISYPNSAE